MGYCIYTICTKNFKDCFDFSIESWLNNTTAEKIYVYTDDTEWISYNDRVEIIPMFDVCSDWLTSVNNKVVASKNVINKPFNRFIFMDIDCYILDDLSHVFEQDFDFAVTRLNDFSPNVRVSTGIFFFNGTEKIRQFFITWEKVQPSVWGKEKACSQSQNSFSILIRKYYKNNDYKILDLDVDVYNRKTSSKQHLPTIRDDVVTGKIKVLHFYNNAFRDDNVKREIL